MPPSSAMEASGMLERILKRRIGDIFFYAAYLVLLIKRIMEVSGLFSLSEISDNTLIIVFFIFFLLKLSTQKFTLSKLCFFGILFAIIFVSCINARYFTPLFGCCLIIAIQGIDLSKLIKVSCYSKAVILLIHIVAYVTSNGLYEVTNKIIRDGRIRHAFFIGHPNTFSFFLTWTIIEYIFVYYEKIRLRHIIIIWLIELLCYRFTDSNSGMIVLSLVCVFVLCEKYTKRVFRIVSSAVIKYGHALLSIFFIVFIRIYPALDGKARATWEAINVFFNGRTLFGAQAIDVYGITFFGRTIRFPEKVFWQGNWMDTGGMTIFDNYYIGHYILFGTVILVLISVSFFALSKKMENKERIVIIAFIFYGVMEAYITTFTFCFALLIIGRYFYDPVNQTTDSSGTLKEETLPLWKRRSA